MHRANRPAGRPVGSRPGGPVRRRWWALAVINLCLLAVTMDNTILNVALPTIARDLAASGSDLQWMVDAYIVVFAGLLLTSGTLGDRLGRRRLLVAGLAVMGGASLATLFVTAPSQLIALRGAMGLGGALLMPATLSIVTNIFDERERPRAIATWSAVSAVGMVLGPMIGGTLLERFEWSSVFLVNVPVALAGIVGALWLVPESRNEHPDRLDPLGALLSIAAIGTLVYGFIEAPSSGWQSPETFGRIGFGLMALAGFIAWELHNPAPMVDMKLFARPAFGAASFAETVAHFSLVGGMFGLTQYLQFVWGQTPFQAGVSLLPIAVGVIAGSIVSSRLFARTGPKALVAAGMAAMSLGLFMISRLEVNSPYPVFAATLLVMSAGMGLAMAPATESIMGAVDKARAGVGSATNDTTRELGSALGVAVLGSVLSSGYGNALASRLGSAGVPVSPDLAAAARDSIGAASAVAAQIGGEPGQVLLAAARESFVSGLAGTALAGAIITAVGAAIVFHWLPGRAPARSEPVPSRTGARLTPERVGTDSGRA